MADAIVSRDEHMRWCKHRALAFIGEGDVVKALASMASDLDEHPETRDNPVTEMMLGRAVRSAVEGSLTEAEARNFIEGFR